MTTLESKNENLDNNFEELLNMEIELSYLETNIELGSLQTKVETNSNAWKVEYLNESKDKKYKIYSYIIETWWLPAWVKAQAVKQLNLETSNWIEITDKNWVIYDNLKKFGKWEKVYIRVPKETKVETNPNAWKVEYLNESKDKKYKIYSYIIETWWFPAWVKAQAVKQLNLEMSNWIEITDKNWVIYDNLKKFEKWEKVYIRVPKDAKVKEETKVNTQETKVDTQETKVDTQETKVDTQETKVDTQETKVDTQETKGKKEKKETSKTKKNNRDNPDYFDNTKKVETDMTYQNKWIILKRDVWMSFYVMNTNDIKYYDGKPSRKETINHLRNKLWALDEFAYLKNNEYAPTSNDVTSTFNIRPDFASYLKQYPNSYYIPIPMETNKRKIEDEKFKSYAEDGIKAICKKHEPYWKYWKWLWLNKSKLATFFTAIAKVETWQTTHKIWTDEYHRRETGSHNCFSFWPHHILMEWPWKRAYNKLKSAWYFSTEWQTYHPKNSTMRCMWFIVEKMKDMWYKEWNIKKEIKNMLSFLNKRHVSWNNFEDFAKMYNGKKYASNNYHNKFAQAYNIVK